MEPIRETVISSWPNKCYHQNTHMATVSSPAQSSEFAFYESPCFLILPRRGAEFCMHSMPKRKFVTLLLSK